MIMSVIDKNTCKNVMTNFVALWRRVLFLLYRGEEEWYVKSGGGSFVSAGALWQCEIRSEMRASWKKVQGEAATMKKDRHQRRRSW